MAGFILEEEEVYAKFIDPNGRDLTSKFMQFAEDFLTNKKGDPQHNQTINSCLIRIPGTINSKCVQMVKNHAAMGWSKTCDKLSIARFQKVAHR